MKTPIRVSADIEDSHPGAQKSATESVINLLRAADLVEGALGNRFRRHGLSLATFNVLMILDGDPAPLCPAEIGERLLVTRGTVTGLLDSLEKRGLIRRTPDPDDRRMLRIEMTQRGRALLKKLLREHFPAEADLMAGLSAREQEQLITLLGKLQTHLHGT